MPRILKRDFETMSEAVTHVTRLEERWKDYWEPYHRWCRMMFRLYMAKNEWTSIGRRARITLSLPFTIIETVAAETYSALFEEQPYFRQKPIGKEDVENAEAVTQYNAYQMDKNHTRIQGYMFEKNRLLFGLGWAQVPWEVAVEWKRREVPVMEPATAPIMDENGFPVRNDKGDIVREPVINPMSGKPMMAPKRDVFGKTITERKFVKEKTKDCWEFQPLYPWQVLSDPAITNPFDILSKGEGLIRNLYLSDAELRRRQREGLYENVDELLDEDDASSDGGRSFDVPQEDEEAAAYLNEGYSYKRHLRHIRQFWGKWTARSETRDGKERLVYDPAAEPVEVLIDICNGVCLRAKRNPIDEQIRPFLAVPCHPIADHLVSPGLLQAVESELRELQTYKSASIDNVTQRMNPMYQVRFGSQVAKRDLRYEPFKKILVSQIDGDIREFPTPDVGAEFLRAAGELNYDIQNATNAIHAAQSTSNVGQAFGRTAAGIGFFQNRMMKRLKVIVDVGEEFLFGMLSDIANSYNAQFLKKPTDFQIIGKENPYLTIKPEAFLQRRDMVPVGAGRKINRGQMMQLADRMITEAGVLKDFVKIDWFIKELVKSMDLTPDANALMYTAEERQQMAAATPPDVKKGLNITINWADLEPELKQTLVTTLMGVRQEEMAPPQAPEMAMAANA